MLLASELERDALSAPRWRSVRGATFVHDVAAVAMGALLAGHVAAALLHPQLLRAMVTGVR